MVTYVYYMPYEIHAYKISCNNKLKDLYKRLLIENSVYKIFLNNELIYKR